MHNFLFGRTKALHYHHFPSQGGAHVGVKMILHGKDCNELHIAQNVCVFDCNIYIVVKSGWEKSSVQLPLGISELGKVQMVGSRTAQRKKMNPQLLFWLQWSQRGLFSLLLWYLTRPRGCRSCTERPNPTTCTCWKWQNQGWRCWCWLPAIGHVAQLWHMEPCCTERPLKDALGAPP